MKAPHKCPAPECGATVPHSQLACQPHWYSIPKPLRVAVWSTYLDQQGSDAHTAAIRDAIAFLRGKAVA